MLGGGLNRKEVITFLVAFSFTAFLLIFPNFGPVAVEIVKENNLNAAEFFSWYLISHMIGIISASFIIDPVRIRLTFLKVTALILLVFTSVSCFYPILIFPVGFFLGFVVVTMGSLLSRCVRPWKRGKVLAGGAAIANVYLVIAGYLDWSSSKLILLAVLPLILLLFLPEIEFEVVSEKRINFEFAKFAFPIVVFYILAGIMYGRMEPVFVEEGIKTHVFFYTAAVLLAGHIYDAIGRRPVSVFGIFLIAIAFASFPVSHLASAYLIQSSYAFIDIFAMLVWADLSYYGSEARQYGIGMFFIVSAIFAGFILSQSISIGHPLIEIVLITLLFSTLLIASAREPMKSPEEYMRWAKRFAR